MEKELEIVRKNLEGLEGLIKKELGYSPKLKAEISYKEMIKISSDENLLGKFGSYGKTVFKEIKIDFWGGAMNEKNTKLWFNPKLDYTHPTGGSNGTQFIWDGIYFNLMEEIWEVGNLIY